ncbi:maintenance of mitochondrial structure and function-domain-containing protein [Blastocladiella britannica]|nr:maintenance of mitochondrial structure and function-domain-containing protein [Blastocladiella britannica]
MATDAGLEFSVHPLVLLNIADHFNRDRLQNPDQSSGIVHGALLGVQTGRHVEIVTSFTVTLSSPSDADAVATGLVLPAADFAERLEQYKAVFPEYDFLGWYSTTPHAPTAAELALHRQFMPFNELPLYARLDPLTLATGARAAAAGGAEGAAAAQAPLPFLLYETTLEANTGEHRLAMVPVRVETGEAERIAVDSVARGEGMNEGPDGALVAHLTSQRNSLDMLNMRVKTLLAYMEAVESGKISGDPALLRQISAVASQLPTISGSQFNQQLAKEYNDWLLTLYLAVLTKSTHITSDIVDRHIDLGSAGGDDRFGRMGSGGGGGAAHHRAIRKRYGMGAGGGSGGMF